MGAEGSAVPSVLRVRLPREAELRVVRDGVPFHGARGAELEVPIEDPGAYRVEARIDGRVWLLSNPVHLRVLTVAG
jgi:hypothetical protein